MSSNTIILIVAAVVVILLLILSLAFAARSARDKKRSRADLDSKWQRADALDRRRNDDADAAYSAAEKDRVKLAELNDAEQSRRAVN